MESCGNCMFTGSIHHPACSVLPHEQTREVLAQGDPGPKPCCLHRHRSEDVGMLSRHTE